MKLIEVEVSDKDSNYGEKRLRTINLDNVKYISEVKENKSYYNRDDYNREYKYSTEFCFIDNKVLKIEEPYKDFMERLKKEHKEKFSKFEFIEKSQKK